MMNFNSIIEVLNLRRSVEVFTRVAVHREIFLTRSSSSSSSSRNSGSSSGSFRFSNSSLSRHKTKPGQAGALDKNNEEEKEGRGHLNTVSCVQLTTRELVACVVR